MEKRNLTKWSSFGYHSVIASRINETLYQNHVIELESKLDHFKVVIEEGLCKVKSFLLDMIKENQLKGKVKECYESITVVENWLSEKGYGMIYQLREELKYKELQEKDLERLNKVVNQHLKIANYRLSKNLKDDSKGSYVEMILDYLLELPYYLKNDLKLDNLKNKEFLLDAARVEEVVIALEDSIEVSFYEEKIQNKYYRNILIA